MLKYSIVTINYKTAEKVKLLWESLVENLKSDEFEFIILDNNSGTAEVLSLREFFKDKPQAHFVALQKNLGFGGGYHEAIRFAQGEYLALINPDIILLPETLDQLATVLEQDMKAGIVAPQLLNPDKSRQLNARVFPSPMQLVLRRFGRVQDALSGGPVPWVQGSFMLMRRRFFTDMLQGFDRRFFLFFEDTDLCRRTWLAGFSVILCENIHSIHGDQRLSGNDLLRAMMRRTFWIHVVSASKYYWKYLGQKTPDIQSKN